MHHSLDSFQDSTIRFNTSKERKTSLQTHCQDTLKTSLDSHRSSENQIRTNNSNNNKQPQHPNNQQPPLYPLYLYLIKISQCLPTHRSLLLRLASRALRKNRPQLFLPQLRSLPVPHHGLRKRRKIIRMNGMTLTCSQRLT